ncbi:MAG: hypothetical protein RIT11_753 [Pseudomonadota bacterium]|jgi:hypothetical protein
MSSVCIPIFFIDKEDLNVDYEALGIEKPKKPLSLSPVKDCYFSVNEYVLLPYEDNIDGKTYSKIIIPGDDFLSPLTVEELNKKLNKSIV